MPLNRLWKSGFSRCPLWEQQSTTRWFIMGRSRCLMSYNMFHLNFFLTEETNCLKIIFRDSNHNENSIKYNYPTINSETN